MYTYLIVSEGKRNINNNMKRYICTLLQVRKGDMLCCHHPLIHIDEAVFGPDATEFKPKRFVGNAALKDEVGEASATERETEREMFFFLCRVSLSYCAQCR